MRKTDKISKKTLTKHFLCDKIVKHSAKSIFNLYIAELCKGSTADSDSVCLGSNPSSAARKKTNSQA